MSSLLIVSPSLNQGQYIEQMISSVLPQLGEEDQFVIVDAGSTDNTTDILARYRADITHVEIAPLKQAPAIRWGFDNFDSDYCCYLNTDDLLLPGAVSRVKAHFSTHPDVGAVYSNRVFVDEDTNVSRIWKLPRHSNLLMQRWDYIPQETCFWRRSAMQEAGGIDPSFDFAMDYDFFCRLMAATRWRRLDGFLAAFRDHPSSKTATLVESIGASEVERIRIHYEKQTHGWWRVVGRLLRNYVEIRSRQAFTQTLRHDLQTQVNQAAKDVTTSQ